MQKNKSMLVLNGLLVVAILTILFFQFYKKQVSIKCNFDSEPVELLELIKDELPNMLGKKLSIIFIFPNLPKKSDIASIGKLQSKFGEKIATLAVFSTKFKPDVPLRFDHLFLPRVRITCEDKKSFNEKNFYLILKAGKVQYAENKIELTELAFMLQKKLNPHLEYSDFSISTRELKAKVTQRLRKGNLTLEELKSSRVETLDNMVGISNVYFIHAACSACQLRTLFSKLKLRRMTKGPTEGKELVIFSVFADHSTLKETAAEYSVNLPVYLDSNDEFGLFSTITNDKDNPLIIDLTGMEETIED